jgi:hypothetical protein
MSAYLFTTSLRDENPAIRDTHCPNLERSRNPPLAELFGFRNDQISPYFPLRSQIVTSNSPLSVVDRTEHTA